MKKKPNRSYTTSVLFYPLIALIISLIAIPVAIASPSTDLNERAAAAYNQGDYAQARLIFIQAIQQTPQDPELYRNLARTYFWKNDYAAATAYYDFYLRLAPPGAADIEQIQSERRLAATRSNNQIWQFSEQQRLILNSLEEQLETGRAYTTGGGGAWSLYQSLLRSEFAQPELITLKRRLVRRLFDEIESRFVVPTEQPAPQLDLDDWKTQRERIEATLSLTNDDVILNALTRRLKIVDAAEFLLLTRFTEAAEQAETAMRENPDLVFPAWYYIVALIHAEQFKSAQNAIEQLETRLKQTAPTQINYVQILRATVLQKIGQNDVAADIYSDILAP